MQSVSGRFSPAQLRALAVRARAAMDKQFYDPVDREVCREFAEFGRTDWAVHVALVSAGTPIAAAVALPALGEVLSTVAPRYRDRRRH